MNPDEEAESALREAYGKRLSEAFIEFRMSLAADVSADAAARLFASHGSFPAYSVWRGRVMGTETRLQLRPEPSLGGSEGRTPTMRPLRAVQILHGERATKEEWGRLMDWAKAHGNKRLKGDDGKWNLSEDELAEALG